MKDKNCGMPSELERLICNYTRNDRNAVNRFLGAAEMCGFKMAQKDLAQGQVEVTVEKFIDMAYEAIQHWEGDSQLEVLSVPLECALEAFIRSLAENHPNGLKITSGKGEENK